MKESDRRNLNPHKSARMAMFLYGERYAAPCPQSGRKVVSNADLQG
jgi:hypothetical protein